RMASIIIYLYDVSTTSPDTLEKELESFDGISAVVIPVGNKADLIAGGFDFTSTSLGAGARSPSLGFTSISPNVDAQPPDFDLAQSPDSDLAQSPFFNPLSPHLSISSLHGEGITQLKSNLVEIVRRDKVKNDIIISNLRHYEALQHTASSLDNVIAGLNNRQ